MVAIGLLGRLQHPETAVSSHLSATSHDPQWYKEGETYSVIFDVWVLTPSACHVRASRVILFLAVSTRGVGFSQEHVNVVQALFLHLKAQIGSALAEV